MSEWRDALLEYLKEDWQKRELESHLCLYFQERAEQMPRVRLKEAFASYVLGETDAGELLATCLKVIQEQHLLELESLKRMIDPRRDNESLKMYKRRARETLKEVIDNPGVVPEQETTFIRSLAEEALSNLPVPSDQISLAMECRWDAEAGELALGSPSERNDLFEKMRKRTSKAKQYPTKWDSSPWSTLLEDKAVPNAIMQRAYTFLDNAGVAKPKPKKATAREQDDAIPGRFVSHTRDIPTGLVERCIKGDPDLATALGIVTRDAGANEIGKPSTTWDNNTRNRKISDAEALYRALWSDRESNRRASGQTVVPVEIDSETGLGLYVLGPDFVTQITKLNNPDYNNVLLDAFRAYSSYPGVIFKKDFDMPFFAIMWRYEGYGNNRSFSFDESADLKHKRRNYILTQNLWNFVVRAWVPDVRQVRKTFGEFAYERYDEAVRLKLGQQAYYAGNYDAPDGCPERFEMYFE